MSVDVYGIELFQLIPVKREEIFLRGEQGASICWNNLAIRNGKFKVVSANVFKK